MEEQYRQSTETTPAAGRAMTESENLARSIKDGALSGFVGKGTVLTGETSFKSMLRVDGQLTGRITSDTGTLIVGTEGQVDANVEVAIATVHGTINGDIVASQRLELGRTARVTGNIKAPSLMIEQGAIFEGTCHMAQYRAEMEKKERKPVALITPTDKPELPAVPAGSTVDAKPATDDKKVTANTWASGL